MMNIQSAIRQCRIARRLGKLTNEAQTRSLRKLGLVRENTRNWERMMALRASIDKEVAPILLARKQAEAIYYQIAYKPVRESKAALKPIKVRRPRLTREYVISIGRPDLADLDSMQD